FQDLVQGLDAIVWEADATTLRFSFVSQRAQTVFGFPTDRWLAEPDFFSKRIHPEDRVKVMSQCRAALARGEDHELEYRALTATGFCGACRRAILCERTRKASARPPTRRRRSRASYSPSAASRCWRPRWST